MSKKEEAKKRSLYKARHNKNTGSVTSTFCFLFTAGFFE